MLTHGRTPPSAPDRVVVLGAGGFVGGAIVRRLGAEGIAHLALTRKELDLLAEDAAARLIATVRPSDAVVFVSAQAPARTPELLVRNLRMAEPVCAALGRTPVAHLVYVSSDAVYADAPALVGESTCCQPSSLHGMMHAARELMLRTLPTPLAILRPSLLYGAADPHNGYGPNRFRRLAARGEAITLFGEGEERRDHVFVDDVAAIVHLVLAHRSSGVLNVATGVSTSFRTIAEMVVAVSGTASEIRGTPRQNPITHRHFDVTACLQAFPAFHYTSLADGLRRAAREE